MQPVRLCFYLSLALNSSCLLLSLRSWGLSNNHLHRQCRFESSSAQDDEATLMKLLEVIGNCMRCGAGHLLTDDNVWDMCQCCFRISRLPHASHLMARMAEATLSHIVRSCDSCADVRWLVRSFVRSLAG